MSAAPQRQPRDAGVTLVEVLVAASLFAVLGSLLLGLALDTSRSATETQAIGTVGEEARLGMERLTRELRQASAVSAVSLPQAANDPTRFTIEVDFNGDGCISTGGADPEKVTYDWDPGSDELTMQASGQDSPLLATKVTDMTLELDSSSWQYDANHDGRTSWQELDSSSIGDHNLAHASSTELANIDLISVDIVTTEGSHTLHYRTSVDLRNQHPNEEPSSCPAPS